MSDQPSITVIDAQERLRKAVRERDCYHLRELGRELKRAGGRRLMGRAFAVLNNKRDRCRVRSAWSDFLFEWV